LYALLDALAAQDIDAMLAAADTMEARALSFDDALQTFASLLHRIALLQFAPQAFGDALERERLSAYARQFSPEFLQLAYQIVVHGRDELSLAPDEHTGFSMTLLRLHAFRPDTAGAGPAPAAGGGGGGLARAMAPTMPSSAASAPQAARPPMPSLKPAAPPASAAPMQAPVAAAASAATDKAPQENSGKAAELPEDLTDWHALMGVMQLGGLVRELAQNCALIEMGQGAVKLRLTPTHKHLLAMPGTQAKLQEALIKHFGGTLRLNVEVGEPGTQTPAQRNAETQRQRHSDAVAALESDPFVQEMIERFDATLVEASVRPLM
jgi:DNA polymerase-3 subunit gamma/tau